MDDAGRTGPSKEDWETHRDTIIKLYTIENMSLDRVRDYMKQEHGFVARCASLLALLCDVY